MLLWSAIQAEEWYNGSPVGSTLWTHQGQYFELKKFGSKKEAPPPKSIYRHFYKCK